MEDIAQALLTTIQAEFDKRYAGDQVLETIRQQIRDGKGTYKQADEYAARTGEILADVLHQNVSSDILPNGRMYYNIANRILPPSLGNNYEQVSEIAKVVQENLNKAAGIGIKAQVPEINTDKIDGIVELASNAPAYDDVEHQLLSAIINYTQSVVTDSVRANAGFHQKSGLSPKIVRTADAGACAWCLAVAGVYDYESVSNTGNDVWRRHRDCRCNVEYDPGNGARQNAHTKMWRNQGKNATIEERKLFGLKELFPHARFKLEDMPPSEYALAVEYWNRLPEYPGLTKAEKEHVYEEFDNWLTAEEKANAFVKKSIGDYIYMAVNKGHNEYKIYDKKPIIPYRDTVDEVLSELYGTNWREILDEGNS